MHNVVGRQGGTNQACLTFSGRDQSALFDTWTVQILSALAILNQSTDGFTAANALIRENGIEQSRDVR